MTADGVAIAVVIAARNEAATIYETLDALAGQDHRGHVHVVVGANGCTDATAAEVVRAQRSLATERFTIELVELQEPGKSRALNAADRRIRIECPRIYLDADVLLSSNALAALVRAVNGSEPRIAAPRKVLRRGRSWFVDFCSRAWLRLPWVQDDVLGGGVLAVSATGRMRWQEFPEVIADDGYVAWQFAPSERIVVLECTAAIRFPNTVRDMLRAHRRWIDGGVQLAESAHRPPFGPSWSGKMRLSAMWRSPTVFLAAVVVRCVRTAARLLVRGNATTSWATPR